MKKNILFLAILFLCLFFKMGIFCGYAQSTPKSVTLLKDINTGSSNSSPKMLMVYNNEMYFRAFNPATGTSLWKTDGTTAGTVHLKTFLSGGSLVASNAITFPFIYNNELYFRGAFDGFGSELWKTNGTTAGTVMVKDITPGPISGLSSRFPPFFTEFNGKLYFSAEDSTNGVELWETDGTEAGTKIVFERPGSFGVRAEQKIVFNGAMYFEADLGSASGRDELYKFNGTTATIVKDINPSGNSDPKDFTLFNNALYFVADDGTHGTELWKTDGTETGTVMVQDLTVGAADTDIDILGVSNGRLFFTDNNSNGFNVQKLYTTDDGINFHASSPDNSTNFDLPTAKFATFSSDDSSVNDFVMILTELRNSNGSDSGFGKIFASRDNGQGSFRTQRVEFFDSSYSLGAGSDLLFCKDFVIIDNDVYFNYFSNNLSSFIAVSDGIIAIPSIRQAPIVSRIGNDNTLEINQIMALGNDLLFVAKTDDLGEELYKYTAKKNIIEPSTTTNSSNNWQNQTLPTTNDDVYLQKIQDRRTYAFSTDLSIKSLELDKAFDRRVTNVSLSANRSITIENDVIDNGGNIITIDSNENDSGVLLVKGTSNATINYKRGGLPANKWSLVTPTVSGQKILEFAQNSANNIRINTAVTPNRYAIGVYNDANANGNKWEYFDTTTDPNATFEIGKSYIVSRASNGSVTFKGALELNSLNKVVTANQWNAIGNSFTTYYPVNKNSGNSFLDDNAIKLAIPAIYAWDNSQTKYVAITNLVTSAEQFLPPGQGFFVRPNANTTLIFDNDKRSLKPSTSISVFNKSANKIPYLKLYAQKEKITVKTDVIFSPTATNGFDALEDIENFDGAAFDINTHLIKDSEGKNFTVQSVAKNEFENTIIPISLKGNKDDVVIFSVEKFDFPEGINVYLEDKIANTFIQLDEVDKKYTITLTKDSDGVGRFYVHTTSSILNTIDHKPTYLNVYLTKNNVLKISGLDKKQTKITLFDVLGKQVLTDDINSLDNKDLEFDNLPAGLYIVKLKNKEGTITQKIIAE